MMVQFLARPWLNIAHTNQNFVIQKIFTNLRIWTTLGYNEAQSKDTNNLPLLLLIFNSGLIKISIASVPFLPDLSNLLEVISSGINPILDKSSANWCFILKRWVVENITLGYKLDKLYHKSWKISFFIWYINIAPGAWNFQHLPLKSQYSSGKINLWHY